jgi:SOS-response transcriptional repressor LexA
MTLTEVAVPQRKKNLAIPERQIAALKARKEETGLDVAEQVRRALKEELKRTPVETKNGILLSLEPVEKVSPTYLPPTLWDQVKERKKESGLDLGQIVQIAIARWLGIEEPVAAAPQPKPDESETLRRIMREELAALSQSRPGFSVVEIGESAQRGVPLHKFEAMPCGPLEETEFEAARMEMPDVVAQILRAKPGDWLVPARGESMVEAGIADGAYVLMRPYPKGKRPLDGDIVLASIETKGGKRFSTIKFWYSAPRGGVRLVDGQLRDFRMPDDFKSVHPMAVFVGIIGPAPNGSGTLKGRRAIDGGRPGVKRNQTNRRENPESE